MPQTGNPEVSGGRRDVQQAANQLEAAAPASSSPQTQVITPESGETITITHDKGAANEKQGASLFADTTPGSPPEGVQLDDQFGEQDTIPNYGSEDEEFLFGATDRPNEPGFMGTGTRPVPPRDAYKYLDALVDASADPGAPQELFTFMRILQDALSE